MLFEVTNGSFYANHIHEPLQSFHLKSIMASYHADESERIIAGMLSSTDEINEDDSGSIATAKAICVSLSKGARGKHILEAQFMAEAHIIASAQALHSLFDIIAIIIYWTFRLDSVPNPIPEKRINLYKIRNALSRFTQYNSTGKLEWKRINLLDIPLDGELYGYAYVISYKEKKIRIYKLVDVEKIYEELSDSSTYKHVSEVARINIGHIPKAKPKRIFIKNLRVKLEIIDNEGNI